MSRFFRAVESDPPTERDFFSMALRGATRKTSKRREYELGVSVYDNYEHLASLMRLNGFYHGRYIATLDLPDDGTCEVAKTFCDPHHYTIYLSKRVTPRTLLTYIRGAVEFISLSCPTEERISMEYYELYDLEHGGIIDEFPSKDEAISALVLMAQDGGRSAIASLSLIKVEDESRSVILREQSLERAVMERIPLKI